MVKFDATTDPRYVIYRFGLGFLCGAAAYTIMLLIELSGLWQYIYYTPYLTALAVVLPLAFIIPVFFYRSELWGNKICTLFAIGVVIWYAALLYVSGTYHFLVI